jgi:hypothetical protein
LRPPTATFLIAAASPVALTSVTMRVMLPPEKASHSVVCCRAVASMAQ